MKIITIVGARPQFIKAAAFSRALGDKHEELIVHTGQHYDENMSRIFFDELEIPAPGYNLGIAGGSHGQMTGRMLEAIEQVLLKEHPELVLLYGDTNSTAAGALAAAKLNIPIAHVEAGCRSRVLTNPEEINRVVTDHISQYLFAPTSLEYGNLQKENLASRAHVVGNIMYDSYVYAMKKIRKNKEFRFYNLEHEEIVIPDRYYYLTCHRQENTSDEALGHILSAMEQMDAQTVYPVHPRNQERVRRISREKDIRRILFLEPVGYFSSLRLLSQCEKVVTDSGGLQCEAFYARKQCVTILDFAPWPQTLAGNRNQLCKADAEQIVQKLNCNMVIDDGYQPFGNGHAAEKIISLLE